MHEFNVRNILDGTDCLIEAIKLKSGLLAGLDKCIDDFEDKRT